MAQPGHKACTYCQEEILATAVKCRYCQEWLIAPPKEAPEEFIGNLVGRELGHYKVTAPIGDGGMGSIWKAHHTTLNRLVAVKVLHGHLVSYKEVVKRFLAEARTVVGLGSPYLVEILDLGLLPDGRPYFVMEYLEGTPLDQWMEGRVVSLSELFTIGEQLLQALSVVHEKKIVHRDLKPSNLMLLEADNRLQVKLLDFGIAKFLKDEDGQEAPRTLTGMTVGTPVYMSPEQAGGLRDIDSRSDIYASGVLLYHVALGRPPFLSDNLLQIMEMHRGSPVPSPRASRSDLPKSFEAWLLRCLSKRREDRYQSAQEALEALRKVRKEVELLGPTPEAAEAIGRPEPKRFLQWAGGALTVLLSGVVLWLLWPASPSVTTKATLPAKQPEPSAPVLLVSPEPTAELLPPPNEANPPEPTPTVTQPPPSHDIKAAEKKSPTRPSAKGKTNKQRPAGLPGPEGLFEPYKKKTP